MRGIPVLSYFGIFADFEKVRDSSDLPTTKKRRKLLINLMLGVYQPIQVVKLIYFVRTFVTCNLDIPITTSKNVHCIYELVTVKVLVEHLHPVSVVIST